MNERFAVTRFSRVDPSVLRDGDVTGRWLRSCGKRGLYPVFHSLSSHDDDDEPSFSREIYLTEIAEIGVPDVDWEHVSF